MSIRLHRKHGLAPTIPICFFCGKEKNEVALLGAAWKGEEEPPMNMCIDHNPCDECAEYMKQGIILVSVRNGSDHKDPHRTGGWAVIKEEAFVRFAGEDHPAFQSRFCFIEDHAWDMLGLPRK